MPTKIVITRKQFESIKEVFEKYDVDHVFWIEESTSGIGPNVRIELEPKKIVIDITDVDSW